MRSLLLLFYIKCVISFNLYSVIYPIRQSFNYVDNKWNWNNKLFPLMIIKKLIISANGTIIII